VDCPIKIHEEVATAVGEGRGVVLLETAVVTHGLPREPMAALPRLLFEDSKAADAARRSCFGAETEPPAWDGTNPVNLELARALSSTVRAAGGIPASTAVLDGVLRIGLECDEITRIATEDCCKVSARDLAPTIARTGSGGTTVAGTLAAMSAANLVLGMPGERPLRLMSTGGIGGVHRGWREHPDISADIRAIASTPALVVCAGAKVILDLPATREALDSNMVPLLGWRTNRFPNFTARGTMDDPHVERVEDAEQVARTCRVQWEDLGRCEGVVLLNEIPDQFGLDPDQLEDAVAAAVLEAREHGISGPELTPYLLSVLAMKTGGRALDANITLLLANASLATQISTVIIDGRTGSTKQG
jgi:pseudouridine-5'-phosphate glycosidase